MAKNKKLERAIVDSEKTIVEIAREMGFSRQYLFQVREDPSVLSLEQAEDIAEILNLEFEEIQEIHREAREAKRKAEVEK